MIRTATHGDLEQIAILHTESYKHHFLPKLGLDLLAKYYKEFMTEDNIFFVDVNENNEIDGLLLGTSSSAVGRNKFIKNNVIRLTLKICWLCIKFDKDTWHRVLKLAEALFVRKNNDVGQPCVNGAVKEISLLSICVSERCKGKGISWKLVKEFEERILTNGCRGYTLSVYKTNDRANHFYKKIGMAVCKESESDYQYKKILISE